MDWWQWLTWGLALATGVTGLVLGIRSELRASAKKPIWKVVIVKDEPVAAGGWRLLVRIENKGDGDALDASFFIGLDGLGRKELNHMDRVAHGAGHTFDFGNSSGSTRPDRSKSFISVTWRQPPSMGKLRDRSYRITKLEHSRPEQLVK